MTSPTFREQYRLRGASTWTTFAEQPSESFAWDDLLSARDLAGADLRVVRVDPPAPSPPSAPTCPKMAAAGPGGRR